MATNDELRAAQNAIAQALSQHASYQYRASSAVVNVLNKRIHEIATELSRELLPLLEGLTAKEVSLFLAGEYRTAKLKRIRDAIEAYGEESGAALSQQWSDTAPKLAAYEAGYAVAMLDKVVEGVPKIEVASEPVYRRAMQTPLSGGAPYGGKLVRELMDAFSGDQSERALASVRSGMVNGQTNHDIVKAIRGTKALNYTDGIAQIARGSAEMFVRTARSHISNQAMADAYEKLGVGFVVFVATLDGRTSKLCAGLDGRRWRRDEPHPTPPLHPNCRSMIAPSMDGDLIGRRPFVHALKVRGGYRINEAGERVPREPSFRPIGEMTQKQREAARLKVGQVQASTGYSKWFAGQDAEFQRQWLGPGRYKLFKEGGYSIDRFSDPLTGKQYTLDQLRARDAETFRQIFGE